MIEALETRIAPALLVTFINGQMTVSGFEVTNCTINRVTGGAIEVRDGSVLMFPPTLGVLDIDVLLAGPDNEVFLNLHEYTGRTDIVFNDANSSVTIQNGLSGPLSVVSGDGNDLIKVNAGAIGRGNITWNAGEGNNTLDYRGSLDGGLRMTSGAGSDEVSITGNLGGAVTLSLGAGTNEATIAGQLGSLLNYTGGSGADTLTLLATAIVEGNLSFRPSTGTNALEVRGTVNADVFYRASSGNDTATFTAASKVEEIFATLGDGVNAITLAGEVVEDVVISGGTAGDTVTLGPAVKIGRHLEMNLGNGPNVFTGSAPAAGTVGSIGGRLEITGGSNADDVSLGGFTVAKKVEVKLGGGANTLTIPIINAGGGGEIVGFSAKKLNYTGGKGVDTISLESNLATPGIGLFKLGGGDDVFTYVGSQPLFTALTIIGGKGIDTFTGLAVVAPITPSITGVENQS
jgi:hypothetical protein